MKSRKNYKMIAVFGIAIFSLVADIATIKYPTYPSARPSVFNFRPGTG
jgi:hypothetical protein